MFVGAAVMAGGRMRRTELASSDPPVRVVADLSARRLSIMEGDQVVESLDRKSTRLNSSHIL